MKNKTKDARIEIRISKSKKEKFYNVCEANGLCPSILIERWINRFINNSKQNKIQFKEIYSATVERIAEYNDYKNS
ncbi:MAG: hypothetical protein SPF22_08065 [Candidatus Onthovivens sp.]|nr:hypothetical protein [Candidatus Onthovivens sp.]